MFKREDRLKELFLREVNLALKDVAGLNTHGILTLTGLELSSDGKQMDVFFSVFGSGSDKAKTQSILTSSIHYISGVTVGDKIHFQLGGSLIPPPPPVFYFD